MRPIPRWTVKPVSITLCLGLLLFASVAQCRKKSPPLPMDFAPDSPATMLHVVDGDTAYFTLEHGGWVKGRLAGINAPECHKRRVKMSNGRASSRCAKDDEFFGLKSYKLLLSLLSRGSIKLGCQRKGDGHCRLDTHGRVLIDIRVGNQDIAEEMVRNGAALTFTKYPSPKRTTLCRAESLAQSKKAGLWGAGQKEEVLALFSKKTRHWYTDHDRKCQQALKRPRRP